MDRKQLVDRALAKAKKYRSFTRWITDRETAQRISALSEKLQRRASSLAKPTENRVRRRARELWVENGRPSGRDKDLVPGRTGVSGSRRACGSSCSRELEAGLRGLGEQ